MKKKTKNKCLLQSEKLYQRPNTEQSVHFISDSLLGSQIPFVRLTFTEARFCHHNNEKISYNNDNVP